MTPLPFDRRDIGLLALCVALALAIALAEPIGFIGGRWDDGRYLEAALDWTAHGPVLGPNHWALRWPVVLPAAAAIEAIERTRAALMLPPLIGFAALIAVTFAGVRAVFADRLAAVIAALALATAFTVVEASTRLNADVPEALFWSCALWSLALAARAEGRRQAAWLAASGVACGLAWATRETAVGLALVLAAAFVAGIGPRRTRWVWLAAGALALWLPEELLLWHASGDPLYRVLTDLHHIDIPSDHLTGQTAKGAFAPLNPGVAARWDGAGPLRGHWWADPWGNLLLNGRYSLVFVAWAVLALAGRFVIGKSGQSPPLRLSPSKPDQAARAESGFDRLSLSGWLWPLALIAAANVIAVVYIIATDPQPRMFMPATAAAAIAVGLLSARAWRSGRRWQRALAIAVLALHLLACAVGIDTAPRFDAVPGLLSEVLAGTTGPIAVDRDVRAHLLLAPPGVRARLVDTGPVRLVVVRAGRGIPLPPGHWALIRQATAPMPFTVRAAAHLGVRIPFQPPQVSLWRCMGACAPLQGPPSVDVGQ